MLDILSALDSHAPTISALSAFVSAIIVIISTGFLIWTTCFRKTRRERVDDLKFAFHLLCHEEGLAVITYANIPEVLDKLEHKFKKTKYKKLHTYALTELAKEGTIEIISTYEAHTGGRTVRQ